MIDPRILRDEPDRVRAAQAKRGLSADVVDQALAADAARRSAIATFETKRAEQKALGAQIPKASPEEKQVLARVEASLLSDISLTDWRQEADAYWRELQKVRGVNTHRRGNPETLLQYVDWFVQRRVLQRTIAEIACKEPVNTPAAIQKGVRLVGLDTGILSKPEKRKAVS